MQYISTRGGVPPKSFKDILLEGLAPDGGLYVPRYYPDISPHLARWRTLSYAELACDFLMLFGVGIPRARLLELTKSIYNSKIFRAVGVISLKDIGEDTVLLGLSEGPSAAFKDLALQLLGVFFEETLAEKNTSMNILGATAAEYAVRGRRRMKIFMLSPEKGMSPFQKAQMYTLQDENVVNIRVQGSFDTCQDMVKALNEDAAFKAQYRLGAVNSINLARILFQVVYYIFAYLRIAKRNRVTFAIPTGNFGNICAAHFARMMGLPIGRLILATNENNVLHTFFTTGIYRPWKDADVIRTSSPSMNIAKASNLERLIFDLFDRGTREPGGRTKTCFAKLHKEGQFALSSAELKVLEGSYGFVSGSSTHADRIATMRKVYAEEDIVIDPHTADGVFVGQKVRRPGEQLVCVETASPIKFGAIVKEAHGFTLRTPQRFVSVKTGLEKVLTIGPDIDALRRIIEERAICS